MYLFYVYVCAWLCYDISWCWYRHQIPTCIQPSQLRSGGGGASDFDYFRHIYNYICVCLSYDPFDSSSFGYPRVVKQFDPENSICSKLILMARSMLGFCYLGIVTRYFESNCHGKIPRQDLAIECDSCSWPIFQRGTGPRKSVKADKDGQRWMDRWFHKSWQGQHRICLDVDDPR